MLEQAPSTHYAGALPAQLAPLSSVVNLLLARRSAGSVPGDRRDGRNVALVIEGGAMRGVVSAGMVAALEQLGLRNSFDTVFGSSAGAVTGAYFVAGQARYGTTIFYDEINNRHFIDFRRILSGKSVVSLEFLLDEVCTRRKPLKFDRVIGSDLPLHIVAASVSKHRSVVLDKFSEPAELLDAMRASARIPYFAGGPVDFRGDRLLDASIYESIPFKAAQSRRQTTDLVVLLTRPSGMLRRAPDLIDRLVIAPYLSRLDSTLARHYLNRAAEYAIEISEVYRCATAGSRPCILPIQIGEGAPTVSPLETSRAALVSAAKHGFRAVYKAFGLDEPALVEIITPN